MIQEASTKELSKLIPPEYLENFMWLYHKLKTELKAINVIEPFSKALDDFKATLTKLKGLEYLTDEGRRNLLLSLFLNLDVNNERAKISLLIALILKRKAQRPRDMAIDILLYLLIGYFYFIRKEEPDFNLIADFLSKKGLSDEISMTPGAFKKRCERIIKNFQVTTDITTFLDFYHVLSYMIRKADSLEREKILSKVISKI